MNKCDTSRYCKSDEPPLEGSVNWYVFATEMRKEQFARQQLNKKSFEVFVPMISRSIRHARKTMLKRVPLFPGYGFIRCEGRAIPMSVINTTPGVKYLLRNNERPAAVPKGFISRLKLSADRFDVVSFDQQFKIGEKARFANGPFVELVGDISSIDNRGRVEILLELLSAKVIVKTHADNLLPS